MENKALYRQYEKLLFEHDRVEKDAEIYLRLYIREFGELLTELFQKKISCIEKKKMLSFCQIHLNYGRSIDVEEMNRYIETEMSDYRRQLNDMIYNNTVCKELQTVTQNELLAVKKLYRKIAKKIHPDLNSTTEFSSVLSDLWVAVKDAYHRNDLEKLEQLDIQINSVLRECGVEIQETEIPDIEEKIKTLEQKIEEIMANDPYQYKFILEDENMVKEMKESLTEEIQEYTRYESQLQESLQALFGKGATFTWEI